MVKNGTGEAVEISAADLRTPLYAGTANWIPADGDGTTLRPGGTVALPSGLPAADCPRDSGESAASETPDDGGADPAAVVHLTLGGGKEESLPAPDPYASLASLHRQDCLQQSIDSVAVFALQPELEVSTDGASAVVRIAVAPTAGADTGGPETLQIGRAHV